MSDLVTEDLPPQLRKLTIRPEFRSGDITVLRALLAYAMCEPTIARHLETELARDAAAHGRSFASVTDVSGVLARIATRVDETYTAAKARQQSAIDAYRRHALTTVATERDHDA